MQQPRYLRHFAIAVLTVASIFVVASAGWAPSGLADYNHNAHGVINYCSLSGTTTTIHGWAHDPDSPSSTNPTVTITIAGQSVTAKTSIEPYHNSAINKYLSDNWPGARTGDTYGFVANFSNLYKGTGYTVAGVAHNYGTGSGDTGLKLDTVASSVDGITTATRLNSNGTIPDACLTAKPLPPPPPPPPPTNPNPGHTGSTGSTSKTSKSTGVPTINSPLDAAIATGTINAVITAPADGTASVLLAYGAAVDNLDMTTAAQDASSGQAVIELDLLQPKTQYFYQIIRQDSAGNRGISATASFTTAGYGIRLHFIDAKGKAIGGIKGQINNPDKTVATSDKNGDLTFRDLGSGQYNVSFKVGRTEYHRSFDTDSAVPVTDSGNAGKPIVLRDIVNVSSLSTTGSGNKDGGHHSSWPLVLLLVVGFAILTVGAYIWLRRRQQVVTTPLPPAGDYALATLPSTTSPLAPIKLPKKIKHAKKAPATPPLQHVGESLPDMVLKAMHEEAQKRQPKD